MNAAPESTIVGPGRVVLVLASLWTLGSAAYIGATVSLCGLASAFGGRDTCAPSGFGHVAVAEAVLAAVLLTLAVAGPSAARAAFAVGAAVLVGSLSVTVGAVVYDVIVESGDPYGYAPGQPTTFALAAAVLLVPGAAAMFYGSEWVRPTRTAQRGGMRAVIVALVLVAGGACLIAASIAVAVEPPRSQREFTSNPMEYRVVLPREWVKAGSYDYAIFLGSVSHDGFDLPAGTDWFDDDSTSGEGTAQISVQRLQEPARDGAAFDAAQARDAARQFGPEIETRTVDAAGHAAVRRSYITATRPMRTVTTTGCALMVPCEDVDIDVPTDDRFYLDGYQGPNVHVVRVTTEIDGRGYVISLFTAPGEERRADRIFEQFLTTFEPIH